MMRSFAVTAVALSTLALACSAKLDEGAFDVEPAHVEATTEALVLSGVGGPCGTSQYGCNAGLVCGTDCSNGSQRCFKCYDPNPPTCAPGQILSNGVCVPAPGGGSGPCAVTFTFQFYPNITQQVSLPLSQFDCNGLMTSASTPRPLPSAPGTGLTELTTAQDYGTTGLTIRGTAPALSQSGAEAILAARDSFVTVSGINTYGFGAYLTLTGVYSP